MDKENVTYYRQLDERRDMVDLQGTERSWTLTDEAGVLCKLRVVFHTVAEFCKCGLNSSPRLL